MVSLSTHESVEDENFGGRFMGSEIDLREWSSSDTLVSIMLLVSVVEGLQLRCPRYPVRYQLRLRIINRGWLWRGRYHPINAHLGTTRQLSFRLSWAALPLIFRELQNVVAVGRIDKPNRYQYRRGWFGITLVTGAGGRLPDWSQ